MARPFVWLPFLISLLVQAPGLYAANTPRDKTNARFQAQCDAGNGQSCYYYGRAMWNKGKKKDAMKSFARGCELKYKLSCDSYHDHSTTTRRYRAKKNYPDGMGDICFSNAELSTATFSPNEVGRTGVHGQKIVAIKPNSFWDKARLQENDIIVRINNLPFNNSAEMLRVFSKSGKTFGFELLRNGETVTQWYTCQ